MVLMNRDDMPFLGVYDYVRYSPYCTPTYMHWDGAVVSVHSHHRFYFQTTLSEGWKTRTPSLSCIYSINRRE